MYSTALPKNTYNYQYSGYLLAIATISLLLFTLTPGTFADAFTSNEQISHTDNELSAAGSGGLAAGHGVNVTASRAGGAVSDAAEGAKGADNTDTAQAGFSRTGGAKSGDPKHEPAWHEPDAVDGSDGAGGGGVAPSGVYMVVAEPDTPYILSARGISSDLNGTYEPLVTAMEVDGSGRKITEHNLSFSRCYGWVEKEITFTTSPNVSEFYVSMNTWECSGTFQVKDVALEVYEAPLPGISDLGYTAGRTWINWTWTNPADVRFAYVTVHLNGTYMGVTPDSFYNATGLDSGSCYEIGVRTVDVGGNVSETGVNQTGETAAGDAGELSVRAYDGLEFSLAEGGAVSGVSIDDVEMPMLSVPGGFSFRELSSTISENLIANPGFETVSGDVPLNWTFVSRAGTVVYDASEGHDSPGSIRINVPGTGDMQSGYPKSDLIDAKPGTVYTFSARGKSSGVDGSYSPTVRVVELNGSGGWITQHNLVFGRDSDWEEKKTSFTTSSDVSKLYVYANIWESYGTFWVDDVTLGMCGTGKIPLVSAVEKNYDGSITQYVTSSDIAFRFDYIPRDRYIEVHGDVLDLRGVDRAIQVQYVLPVDATGWQWGDYIRESRAIGSGVRYENVYKIGEMRTQNTYSFTFVGEDAQGLSLAVPMDVPRIYRIGYDTGAGGYSIEYDFGLANCTDKIGAGHANFTFIVYKVDGPEWGFRAVAKKYYELYPEFFVKRNEWEGLWVRRDTSDIPNASDFGFAFDDSHYHPISRRVYDHQHGIYPMQYTEPWGWWRSFGDNSTEPSYDEKIVALMDDYNNGIGMWRDVVITKFAAEAVLNSAPYDKNKNHHLDDPYRWHEYGTWQQNYPENPDPDIPSPNRCEISYAEYDRSNESGFYAYHWSFGSNLSIDTIAHSGNYAGKIEILGTFDVMSGSLITDHISVTPSTKYNFSVWGKTLNCGGTYSPCVRAAEYDSNGTWIAQKNLDFGFGTTNWTEKTATFTTTTDTAYVRVYANIYSGYGTFWFDDVELHESDSDINLVENHSFESTYNASDYPSSGFYVDSLHSNWCWPEIENYRREHWEYTDYPLVFSYNTKQPVLLGTLSQYEYLASIRKNMTNMDKLVNANIFPNAYSYYEHLIDVLGGEVWHIKRSDSDMSLRRTMSYQKTNSNLLHWEQYGDDPITHNEVENYMDEQMFYGMFPTFGIVSPEEIYGNNRYWNNDTFYERDRDLFKKCIPIIREISAAGWEPIPYAACDNPDIKFERYGDLSECLYYTVASRSSMTESGVLSVGLSKLGFDGTSVEVKELVTNITSTQSAEDGKMYIALIELHPYDTLVYKISP